MCKKTLKSVSFWHCEIVFLSVDFGLRRCLMKKMHCSLHPSDFSSVLKKKKNERNGECDLTRATLMWQIVTFFVEIRGCLLVFDDFEFFDSSWSVFLISFPLSWKTMIWMKIWFGWVIFKFWDEHLVMNEVPLAYCCHLMNQMIVMSLSSIFVVCFA